MDVFRDQDSLEELRHSNVQRFFQLPLSHFLNSTKAAIFITDNEDRLIWMSGLNQEEAEGADFLLNKKSILILEYFQEFIQNPQRFLWRTKELLKRRRPFYGEKIFHKNGSLMKLDYQPIFDEHEFLGAIWLITDDSRNKKMLSKDVNYSSILPNNMLDKIHVYYCEITEEGSILRFSPSLTKLTGLGRKDLRGKNFLDLCVSGKEPLAHFLKMKSSELLSSKANSYEVEFRYKAKTKWAQCYAFYQANPEGPSHWKLFMIEITEQKEVQQELKFAQKMAEQARLAQQQFLSSMSHDIRTPLNAIIGMTMLLADTSLTHKQEGYIKVLKNASNILLDLLNGVLDLAKIESGKQEITPKEFDLPDLLQSLIDTFSFKLSTKQVELTHHIDPRIEYWLIGDSILLNQILMNLLTNAEKFTKEGQITLTTKVQKEDNQNIYIEFRIEDTGIGISKEKIDEIFQDFIQDNNIRLEHGGSGLGLFICKRLIELLGGQVSVKSVQKQGTTFSFVLPFIKTNKLIEHKMDRSKPKNKHIDFSKIHAHILVVEDNPMNLKYLSSLLEQNQINYDVASDGTLALQKAMTKYYDLILMDMQLPGMSGTEITTRIRNEKNDNAATPIILVSAAAFQSTLQAARTAGANEVLTKPYTPDQLTNILQKYLIEEEEEEPEIDDGSVFRFNEKLDIAYLDKLYAGNSNYALSLFDVFLECTKEDWTEIQRLIKMENWTQLKDQVHKVKPNFSMVGLTQITTEMQEVYDKLKEGENKAAVTLLQKVQKDLDEYIPIIKDDFKRMRDFVLHRGLTE